MQLLCQDTILASSFANLNLFFLLVQSLTSNINDYKAFIKKGPNGPKNNCINHIHYPIILANIS